MTRRTVAWAVVGALALTVPAWAQGTGGDEQRGTVKREEVKTWIETFDGKEYSVHPATPSYAGDTGLFHLSTAYVLPAGKVSLSLFRDNLDRDPKDIDFSTHGITFAYGATSKLELFGSVGIQNRVRTAHPEMLGFYNDLPLAGTVASDATWQTGFGDIWLGGKYQFTDDYGKDPVAFALRARVKVPTADKDKGLGTGKVSFGADAILSKHLSRSADIHAMLGYQFNSSPSGYSIGNALRWGVGLNLPACQIFQLQADLVGTKYSIDGQQSPVDLVVGPVVWFAHGIFVRPALSWNVHFAGVTGSTMKSYMGRQISVGYHPGTKCCAIAVPKAPPVVPTNRPPTVACETSKSVILPGETVRCRATASDPDGDPVTLSWKASAGRVAGTGTEATFDSAGVVAPATVTLTVTADDGRGGTASAQCPVRVEEPKRAPEPITCTSGGFPRNSPRLNNVDKACLDDVALRARQDPQGRVVVIGYADSTEHIPVVTARKRAEAVKGYLVKQGGVEESRVTVRSAGATKPLDTGRSAQARAKNRRVDIVYLPAGAVLPEGQ